MGWKIFSVHVVFIFVFCIVSQVYAGSYGILAAESSSEKENFCIIYFPQFSSLPTEKSKANFHILEDESYLDLCNSKPIKEYKQKVVLLTRNSNCSLAFQARAIQEHGGVAAVFITPGGKVDHLGPGNSTEGVNITVALIPENSVNRLRAMKDTPTACIYAPDGFSFDLSLLVIWIVAIFTVCVGGYWSGLVRYSLYSRENNKIPQTSSGCRGGESSDQPEVKHQFGEESSLNISPYAVGVFVICMGATLSLLYFFFNYLVYFLIGLFVLVSINSVYVCLRPLVMKVLPTCLNLFECHYKDRVESFDYRHLLLLVISLSVSITWVATRNEKYSWVLQDILGVLFCINMLRTIRLPNLKICTLLLTLLFFYDIFFVFVTPFLTAKGESVMEEVATGGQSEEKLPMVLRVPHFGFDARSICYQQFSMLGFGDILVPGLLISYCHGFDLITGNNFRVYFLLVLTTYGLGLLVTFVGLLLMETAQPALLYLVPATLIPPVLLAWYRRELALIWNGFKKTKTSEVNPSEAHENAVASNSAGNVELSSSTGGGQPSLYGGVGTSGSTTGSAHDTNERKQLLQQ